MKNHSADAETKCSSSCRTKKAAARFERALAQTPEQPAEGEGIHPLLWQAHREALRGQLEDLHSQLRDSKSPR